MFIVSLCSLCDIPASPVFGLSPLVQTLYTVAVAALKATLLTLLLSWMARFKFLKLLRMPVIIIFSLAAAVNFIAYKYYGFGISRRMIAVFLETNRRETGEFISSMAAEIFSPSSLLNLCVGAAGITVFFLIVRRCGKRLFAWVSGVATLTGCVAALIFCTVFTTGRTAHSLMLRIARYSVDTYNSRRELMRQMSLMEQFPADVDVQSAHSAENIIMIIGESASRGHLSAYGYPLATSPVVDSMADSLFIFTDVIGSSTGTSGNMERIMTFKHDDTTFGDGYRYPLVIDFFRKAGYRTYWLSNQERVGEMSNLSGVLNSRADMIKYVGADNSEDALLARYDEALLPELTEALTDTAQYRFICMHLLGSHVVYSNRYPPHAAVFTADDLLAMERNRGKLTRSMAQTVAEYDNSIRYTDYILGSVIRSVAASEQPSIVLYFSDHGENVYDKPDAPRRDAGAVTVPFIIYLNEAYRRQNPELSERLGSTVDIPFSTANVVYPLMTLSGSSAPELYDSTYDFMSDGFTRRVRYVDELPWTDIDNAYK
ncbi:MAG: phosphoethanolamine transferase [Muribaculaceae bacterium]|nr:phosphoethanolamine transferase [Muribaculaceae bacterium]